jgi:endonuclease YncB( thermonuclease family)
LKNILSGLHPIIGNKISIRVNGIDTPDIRGKCEKEKYDAKQAQQMVTDILKDADQIVLRNMERGKYFRIAADVIVDGESLGDLLVEASGDGQRIEGESTLSLYFILGELDGTCNFFY